MNKILKLFFVFLFFHSTVFSTDYWQPYPIHAEVITYNNIDRKVKFSVYDSLSGIWRYYNTPFYTCPSIVLTDSVNTIVGFKIYDYDSQMNLELTGYYGFIIFDQKTHQFKPIFEQITIPFHNYLSMSMEVDDASMTFNFEDDNGWTYVNRFTVLYSIIKNKWDTINYIEGVHEFECLDQYYLGNGYGYTCYEDEDGVTIIRNVLNPETQKIGRYDTDDIIGFRTSCHGISYIETFDLSDFSYFSYCSAFDPNPNFGGFFPNPGSGTLNLRFGILQIGDYTITYDDSLHQMKIDSLQISGMTGLIIKDGVVACKNGTNVYYKVFSPVSRTWIVGTTISNGIDSLKVVNGTVKWKDNSGTSLKAGYIDSLGWGNYDTPLLLSFHATERYTSSGMPYVFVRNYSIGTDSICYDFGDGVISNYNQHSLWHLYKVNGHYQSAYPSVNYNICIKTVNDSGPQSSCQSFAITCVDATAPVITTTPTIICSNDSVILNLTGSLNTATKWAWYEGSCGNGAAVDTGSTITVKPLMTTTYFVRGEGGCTMSTVCDSITITVLPTPPSIVTASGPLSFCLGDSVILSVTTGVGINHQWKNYGNVISGATLSDHTVYSQGYYNVIVNDSTCFNTSNTLHVTVPCLLPFDSDLKLTTSVPNQMETWYTDGVLYFQCSAIYGIEFSIVVYDLPGKLVFVDHGKIQVGNNTTSELNYQKNVNLNPGIYLLHLTTPQKNLVQKFYVN